MENGILYTELVTFPKNYIYFADYHYIYDVSIRGPSAREYVCFWLY